MDRIQADGFVEILDQHGVGPCLVRRVVHLPLAAADKGADDGVLGGGPGITPLLQLDDDSGALAIFPGAGDDEIDAFAGLRDVELDRDARVVRNPGILQNRAHVAERILPRGQFTGTNRLPQRATERVVDDLLDPVGEDVVSELGLVGEIDDHFSNSYRIRGGALWDLTGATFRDIDRVSRRCSGVRRKALNLVN